MDVHLQSVPAHLERPLLSLLFQGRSGKPLGLEEASDGGVTHPAVLSLEFHRDGPRSGLGSFRSIAQDGLLLLPRESAPSIDRSGGQVQGRIPMNPSLDGGLVDVEAIRQLPDADPLLMMKSANLNPLLNCKRRVLVSVHKNHHIITPVVCQCDEALQVGGMQYKFGRRNETLHVEVPKAPPPGAGGNFFLSGRKRLILEKTGFGKNYQGLFTGYYAKLLFVP